MNKPKKTRWVEFGWSGAYPIQCIPPMKAWVFDFAKIGYPLSQMALTFSQDNLSFYVHKDEYEGFGKRFFELTLKNPAVILSFLEKTNHAANQIFKLEKPWSKLNFSKLTNKQLISYHESLFDIDETLWRNGQPQNLLEMGNSFVTAYLRKNLKKKYGAKKEIEHFQIISTSRYDSVTERQDRDFIKLYKVFKSLENKAKQKKLLRNHWQKYCWMTYGWTGPAVSLETFRQNLQEAIKHPKILLEMEKRILTKKQMFKAQSRLLKGFSKEIKQMAVVLRDILECKARRTDAHCLTYFLADPLLTEIGRRLGLSLNQLRAIDPPRVRTLFKKLDVAQINNEISFVVYWFEKGRGIKIFTGKKAKSIMNPILAGLPKVKKVTELKGEMAFPGKVRGRVKIIDRARDIQKFSKGEILVTAMTDPGFVPAMKIAKAVVTNSGGITCHAAIISRELQIPCIIGTKIATKILKDGDMVEVDANKGVVKLLKKG